MNEEAILRLNSSSALAAKEKRDYPLIVIYGGQTRYVTPGNYDRIVIYSRGVLEISPGTYNILNFVTAKSESVIKFIGWNGTATYSIWVGTYSGFFDGTGQIRLGPDVIFQKCPTGGKCTRFTLNDDVNTGLVQWESGYYPPYSANSKQVTSAELRKQLRQPTESDPGLPSSVAIWMGANDRDDTRGFTFGQLDTVYVGAMVFLDQGSNHIGCVHSDLIRFGTDAKFHPGNYSLI